MKLRGYFVFFLLLLIGIEFNAQVIYNAYANVTNISGNTFTVANVSETNHTFVIGESVVIIQMQDNVIGTNTTNISSFGDIGNIQSAGLYEFQIITNLTRSSGTLTTLTFSGGIVNTYNINSNSRVQVVTLRKLSTTAFTTTNNITGTAWNGTIGGVIALQVGTDLTLNHNISADGIGFRGGATTTNFSAVPCTAPSNTVYIANDNQQGFKGEGIYRSASNTFNNCRGKILTGGGGGNNHNAGGGGGGNYEQGGLGGLGWTGSASGCTANPGGGLGGISLKTVLANRVFMGGGGGGGQQNDGAGSAGGDGGGIIFLKADKIITSGSCSPARQISANGETPANSGLDGAGGGGAAGTMYLQVNTYSVVSTCSLNISVNGGNGAAVNYSMTHGAGGAGSQGILIFSGSTPTSNILATANNGTPGCNNNSSPCTNSAGVASGADGGGIQPGNSGGSCSSTNLLTNPSFEFSVVPSVGNNLTGLSSWGGWTIPSGAAFNVVKTDGSAYPGGPNNAQNGTQYIDITSAAGDLDQKFRVSCTTTLNFNGYFSSREASGSYANWTGSIQIVGSSGSVAASNTKNFTNANGNDEIWFQVTGTAVVAAGDYTFRARLGDFGNFDNAFLCGTNCLLLPIELIDFNASYIQSLNQVNLQWQTASEKNSAYFTIKRSTDAVNWQEVKKVSAAGNSSIKREYWCTDNIFLEQIMYYRLIETDLDGNASVFKTVAVNPKVNYEDLLIYPNPTKGEINVRSNRLIRVLTVLDCFGNEIENRYPNDFEIKFELIHKGVYFIKAISDYQVSVKKIIVE